MSKQGKGNVNSKVGAAIIALLNLQPNQNDRIDTIIGDKSEYGLAMTVARILDDESFRKSLIKGR